jgi:hypothetical protein
MSNQFKEHPLLDRLISIGGLKNDAALARALETTPSSVCKMRHGVLPIGPSTILRAHETFNMPVKDIRQLLAVGA